MFLHPSTTDFNAAFTTVSDPKVRFSDLILLSFYGEGGAYHVPAADHQGAVEVFQLYILGSCHVIHLFKQSVVFRYCLGTADYTEHVK